MKKQSKMFVLLIVTAAIASCTTAQKNAKLEITPVSKVVRHSDESADGYYALGRYLQDTQRSDEAFQEYLNAIKVDPNHVKARIAIAVLQAKRGDYLTSIAELKIIVEKSPSDAYIYNNLGYAYYLNGDYNNAVLALEKALAIDSTNVRTMNNLADSLYKLGQTERAGEIVALAKTIKTGKIRPADNQAMVSGNIKTEDAIPTLPLTATQSLAMYSEAGVEQNNTQTEIKKVSSGIYEITKTEVSVTIVANSRLANVPAPEIKILAQSGGVSFKIHPLVNKLFDENAVAIAAESDLSNRAFVIEIVNGNGVKGFARKAAETLTQLGLNQPQQLANKIRYNQYKTVLEYRVGYRAEAIQLAKTLSTMPALRKFNSPSNNADLRLVLGRDAINPQYIHKYDVVTKSDGEITRTEV